VSDTALTLPGIGPGVGEIPPSPPVWPTRPREDREGNRRPPHKPEPPPQDEPPADGDPYVNEYARGPSISHGLH
jgi:hypothetical protein